MDRLISSIGHVSWAMTMMPLAHFGSTGAKCPIKNNWPMQFTLVRDYLPRRMRSFDVEKLPI